ncbi:hypothetical protein HDU92_008534 [Lobulomyces angularis]|nr:hypothetical protein HDU92_008534 [Lobulomyces angularis]
MSNATVEKPVLKLNIVVNNTQSSPLESNSSPSVSPTSIYLTTTVTVTLDTFKASLMPVPKSPDTSKMDFNEKELKYYQLEIFCAIIGILFLLFTLIFFTLCLLKKRKRNCLLSKNLQTESQLFDSLNSRSRPNQYFWQRKKFKESSLISSPSCKSIKPTVASSSLENWKLNGDDILENAEFNEFSEDSILIQLAAPQKCKVLSDTIKSLNRNAVFDGKILQETTHQRYSSSPTSMENYASDNVFLTTMERNSYLNSCSEQFFINTLERNYSKSTSMISSSPSNLRSDSTSTIKCNDLISHELLDKISLISVGMQQTTKDISAKKKKPKKKLTADVQKFKLGINYRAQAHYLPRMDDELKIKKGDIIMLEHIYPDMWGVAINKTSGKKGIVALEFLTEC